jgi:hypothetical protein
MGSEMAQAISREAGQPLWFLLIRAWLVSVASTGTIFGFFSYHIFGRREYPLYYNLGYRLIDIRLITLGANILLCGLALTILRLLPK